MSRSLSKPSSPRHVLARILDEAALVAEVRALPARALAKLIDHIGLEDSAEIVDLATVEQLERVFDDDLWRSRVFGEDEAFDAARFIVWLEILLETGDRSAARKLIELPKDLVTLAFQKLVIVIDVDALRGDLSERHDYTPEDRDDANMIDKALESALSHDVGSYMIVAREHNGWDAIITVLVALDEEDNVYTTRLLERCAAMASHEAEEAGGLHELLTAEESLESDVAGERADRRAAEGFVAASDARSFLRLARESSLDDIMKSAARDPVTRAYFREVDRSKPAPPPAPSRLLRLLESSGVMSKIEEEEAPAPKRRGRLGKKSAPPAESLLNDALAALEDDAIRAERLEELAFLVNVLVTGAVVRIDGGKSTRAFRPAEAAEAVVEVVNAGLAHLAKTKKKKRTANEIVAEDGVVIAFRVGLRLREDDPSPEDLGWR